MNPHAKWLLAITLAASGLCTSVSGHAVDKQACFASFDSSQELRKEGKLTAAREQALICASGDCPAITVSKCSEWLDELEKQIPTVVIVAKDTAGADTTEVTVSVDGKTVADKLDGRPISLDPGAHSISFAHGTAEAIIQQVVVAEGEQNRKLSVDFSKPGASDSSASVSPLVYVGFSIAGAGVIAGAITGGLSLSIASDLQDVCPDNHCTDYQKADFDNGQLLAHISTAGFAVAGAGAVIGVIGLLLPSTPAAPGEEADDQAWRIEPHIGFGSIGLSGRF